MPQSIIILYYAIFAGLISAGFILGWVASKKDWQTLKMCFVVALIGFPFGWVVGLSVSPVIQTVITSLVAVVASGVAILSRISSADKSESVGSQNDSDAVDEEGTIPSKIPTTEKAELTELQNDSDAVDEEGTIPSKIPTAEKAESTELQDDSGSTELQDDSGSTEKKLSSLKKVDPLPIAILMVAFAIGSPFGVYYRANGMFGTDPKVIVERWKKVGLDDKEVAQVVFRSIYPSVNSKNDKNGDNAVVGRATLDGGLFSGELTLKVNEGLERSKWLPDEELAGHLSLLPDERIRKLAQKYDDRPDILRAFIEELTWKSEKEQ